MTRLVIGVFLCLLVIVGAAASSWWLYQRFTLYSSSQRSLWWHSSLPAASNDKLVRIPWNLTLAVAFFIATSGLLLSFVLSIVFYFDSVTATHCNGFEFVPSISATIGDNGPPRYIWRAAVTGYVVQRYAAAFIMHSLFSKVCPRSSTLNSVRLFVHQVFLQPGLVILTTISSSENLTLHKAGFVVFCLASIFNSIATCLLTSRWQSNAPGEKGSMDFGLHIASASARWRWRTFQVQVACLVLAAVAYRAHSISCGNLSYSRFTVCEWAFVATHMAHNMCELKELGQVSVKVGILGDPRSQRGVTYQHSPGEHLVHV